MRKRTLIIALSAGMLAAGIAGWMIGRPAGPASEKGAGNPIGGLLATETPTTDSTYVLTALITGPPSSTYEPCYSDKALGSSFVVREEASSALTQGAVLALADSVESLGCDYVVVTFTVPRAAAYTISREACENAWLCPTWGPLSFAFLDRSAWFVNLSEGS